MWGRYAALGYEALLARPPVVYVSAACRPAEVTTLLASLGLPGAAVRQVALSGAFGPAHAMDAAHLQRLLDEDGAAQKVPLLVLTHAGEPADGQGERRPLPIVRLSGRMSVVGICEGVCLTRRVINIRFDLIRDDVEE